METDPPLGEDQDVDEEDEEEELLSDASPWTYSSSPDEPVGIEGGCGTDWERGGSWLYNLRDVPAGGIVLQLEGWSCCRVGRADAGEGAL